MMALVFAWLVHLYTAMGLVCAAGIAVFIVRGDDASFRASFLLMLLATAIDATDGWLARKADVKHVLPFFDGRRLDDIVDFQLYTSLPLLLLWRANILPGPLGWVLIAPLLASAYGFSRTDAKTDDGFFLGFPSYWNVVAFYLYVLSAPVWVALALIVTCSVLTFVPTRYLYVTQGGPFAKPMIAGVPIWGALIVLTLLRVGDDRLIAWLSLTYPAAYLLLSWTVSLVGEGPANRV